MKKSKEKVISGNKYLEIVHKFDHMIIEANDLIRTLKIYPKVFKDDTSHEFHNFFDRALFTTLNHSDLIIGLKYVELSQMMGNMIETNYFTRRLVLTSHEILDNLGRIVGRDVRNELHKKSEKKV